MFNLEHPNQDGGVRGYKWKLWHDTYIKRDADALTKKKGKKEQSLYYMCPNLKKSKHWKEV